MPEYTATSQFIPAHTDLSWNTVNPEKSANLFFKNPSLVAKDTKPVSLGLMQGPSKFAIVI